ncbi:MAG: T9SS type A sorting domain-containing protein [Bacteroidales bacterium]|nr:T9SS type A sorting domain-containing protein [Bacteroidales bacterium]
MKRVFIIGLAMIFATSMFAQKGLNKNSKLAGTVKQSASIQKNAISDLGTYVPGQSVLQSPVNRGTLAESELLKTIYDLQSNSVVSNRAYRMDDGTMMFTATISEDEGHANRGSGFNYFNGSTWNEMVEMRNVEEIRSGWPSIAPFGTGAVLFSHSATDIEMYKCEDVAAGVWTNIGPLPGSASYAWPRTGVTVDENGTQYIHVIASEQNTTTNITTMKYWRSADGGATWEGPSDVPGFTNADDRRFITDNMTICTQGSTIVILFVDFAANIGYARSDNNGETFEYHPIYESVLDENFFYISTMVEGDTIEIWSPGSGTGVLDNDGILHVVLNTCLVSRDYSTEEGYYSYYYGAGIDGIYYWNEEMGTIPTSSEFVNHIGEGMMTVDSTFHMIKADECEQLVVVGALGGSMYGAFEDGSETWPIFSESYTNDNLLMYSNNLGLSIMPCIAIDNYGRIIVVYSSITKEGTTGGDYNKYYRRLYAREYNPLHPETPGWQEESIAITNDFTYELSEVVYPLTTLGNNEGEEWNIFYSVDNIPGLLLDPDATGAQSGATDNYYRHNAIAKSVIPQAINEDIAVAKFEMMPNPAKSNVTINVSETATIEIYNTVGQLVKVINNAQGSVSVDVSSMANGVYLVNVRNANGAASAQKLIVQ